jgi:hypothetical protein
VIVTPGAIWGWPAGRNPRRRYRGERGTVGGSGADHGQAGRFGGIQAVKQCGGDAPAGRAGMDSQPADIQGAVGPPGPGHRPGQAGLVGHTEERLAAAAQFLKRFVERRDAVESAALVPGRGPVVGTHNETVLRGVPVGFQALVESSGCW